MDNSGQDSRKYALRIYTIIKNGPLDKCGANELTDFIIPPDEVFSNQMTFEDWVKTHSNQEIILSFYSLLTKKFRDIKIKTNPLGSKEGILGASVQKENWTLANKKILHIISVKENSFAQKDLGLIPNEDYIVGVKCKASPIIPLNNDDFSPLEILSEVIRKNKGNSVKFYIYNKEKGARDVTAKIGNDYYFSLGCDGAFGALHMFPSLEMEMKLSLIDVYYFLNFLFFLKLILSFVFSYLIVLIAYYLILYFELYYYLINFLLIFVLCFLYNLHLNLYV